jgi:protein ImuA
MFRGDQQILDELRERVRQVDLARDAAGAEARIISSGIPALDALLPEKGLRRGTLWEWLCTEGSGAGSVVFYLLREVLGPRGMLVLVDPEREFYPPAAAAAGLNLDQVVVVRPRESAEALWALEQSLRCPGVAAVWCALNRLRDLEFRRLQLAAEAGAAIGILHRPSRCRSQPSWADVRLSATPVRNRCEGVGSLFQAESGQAEEADFPRPEKESRPPGNPAFRRLSSGLPFPPEGGTTNDGTANIRRIVHLEVLHCRGGTAGGTVDLELCDATGDVRVVSALAAPAVVRRSARA